jgi:hypothetical protein
MDKDTQSVGMFNRHDLYQSMFDEIEGSTTKKPPKRDSCENRTRRSIYKSPKLCGGTPGTLLENPSKLS